MTAVAGVGGMLPVRRQILVLIAMKARLLANTLTAGRSWWSLGIGAVLLAIWLWVMGSGSLNLIQGLNGVFPASATVFLLSLMLLYLIVMLFISDLFLGHTMNVGQMSTDHTFLSSLPIAPSGILALKLFERMAADWLGIFLLLAGFLGVTQRDGFHPSGLLLAIVLYLQIQLLLGTGTSILSTFLQRFLRPTSLSNLFSFLAYASSFLGFLPVYWVSQNPMAAFWKVLGFRTSLEAYLLYPLTPATWIVETLVTIAPGPGFWKWSAWWTAGMVVGGGLFTAMIRHQWIGVSQAAGNHQMTKGSPWLSGFFRKEFLLLKSDFNLLTNALFLPVTIILLQIWLLGDAISIQGRAGAMNALAIAALYFCMFGPINAVGSEGKAIFQLETLPISPMDIIRQKTIFWVLIAEGFFLPAAVLVTLHLGMTGADMLAVTLWIGVLIPAFVLTAVAASAVFPDFSARILQKSSTISGKLLAAFAMSLALPVKKIALATGFSLVSFLLVLGILLAKARLSLRYRLDPSVSVTFPGAALDAFLVVAVSSGIASQMRWLQNLLPVASQVPTILGYSFTLLLFAGFALRTNWGREDRPRLLPSLKALLPSLLLAGLGVALFRGLAGRMMLEAPETLSPLMTILSTGREVWTELFGSWGRTWWVICWCAVIPCLEEGFLRGVLDDGCRRIPGGFWRWPAAAASALAGVWLLPLALAPYLVVRHVGAFCLFRWCGNLLPGLLFACGCQTVLMVLV